MERLSLADFEDQEWSESDRAWLRKGLVRVRAEAKGRGRFHNQWQ